MSVRTRRMEILDMLQKQHEVKVSDLASYFKTSEMTIRRDLGFLSSEYNITRTHGGATISENSVVRTVSFDENKISNKESKELIARKAVELVEFRSRIFIDAGSTTRTMINHFHENMRNIIVTNSLSVADTAMMHKGLSVIMLGGEMLPIARCSFGQVAEQQILRYPLDIAFLGAAAVGSDGKMYDGYSLEARFKGALFEVAERICLLVDSTKFNCYDLHEFGSLKQVDTIITDAGVSEEMIAHVEE